MKKLALIAAITALTSLAPVKAMVPVTHTFDCPQPSAFKQVASLWGATSPQGTLYIMHYIPGYTVHSLAHLTIYKTPTNPPTANSNFKVHCSYLMENPGSPIQKHTSLAIPKTNAPMFTGTSCVVTGGVQTAPLGHPDTYWDCTAGNPCQVTCQ